MKEGAEACKANLAKDPKLKRKKHDGFGKEVALERQPFNNDNPKFRYSYMVNMEPKKSPKFSESHSVKSVTPMMAYTEVARHT
jgi:hypothetical protein